MNAVDTYGLVEKAFDSMGGPEDRFQGIWAFVIRGMRDGGLLDSLRPTMTESLHEALSKKVREDV